MHREEMLYSKAKDNLKKYGRKSTKTINEKIAYECAVMIYLIKSEYRTDTRHYNISPAIYQEMKTKVLLCHGLVMKNQESYEAAIESARDALEYIELVVKPRTKEVVLA